MNRSFLLCLLFFGVLSGCYYEVAQPPKIQHLHIASDVLTSSDTMVFRSLKKFKNIHVHIHHLSLDSLDRLLEEEGVTTRFDMVLFSSIEAGLRFERKGRLQTIYHTDKLPSTLLAHFSQSKKLLGIGYNPYVVRQQRSDSLPVVSYADLIKKKKWQSCNEQPMVPFFASVHSSLRNQAPKVFSKWVERFLNQQTITHDSISNSLVSFGRLTDCAHSIKRSERIVFPNQQLNGCYSDMVVVGIVHQARNYTVALDMLKVLDFNPFLETLTNSFHSFPASDTTLTYNGQKVRIYPVSPMLILKEYDECQSIVKKKKKKKANL